jgi:hypothetical protein
MPTRGKLLATRLALQILDHLALAMRSISNQSMHLLIRDPVTVTRRVRTEVAGGRKPFLAPTPPFAFAPGYRPGRFG